MLSQDENAIINLAHSTREVKAVALDTPVLIGSGLDVKNAANLMRIADGAIVGTALKKDGLAGNPVCASRVRQLAKILGATRAQIG